MKKHNLFRGFTLIEMLVVIAIIAILTGVVLASLSGAKSKSRDGKRISDISQIQLALEQYFDRCQAYPSTLTTGTNCIASNGATVHLSDFISAIPSQPTGGSVVQTTYGYYVSAVSDYVLVAFLENSSDVLKDSLTNSTKPSWATTADCTATVKNNDKSYHYCVGPK
jgi:prepilin-type N-terminal cleavage/methylation domain-containing protein